MRMKFTGADECKKVHKFHDTSHVECERAAAQIRNVGDKTNNRWARRRREYFVCWRSFRLWDETRWSAHISKTLVLLDVCYWAEELIVWCTWKKYSIKHERKLIYSSSYLNVCWSARGTLCSAGCIVVSLFSHSSTQNFIIFISRSTSFTNGMSAECVWWDGWTRTQTQALTYRLW